MPLEHIKVQLYYPTSKDYDKTLVVNGQSGLCWLTIRDKNKGEKFQITVAFRFNDLEKVYKVVEESYEEDCPICHGLGYVIHHHDPCTECDGIGRVGGEDGNQEK